MKRLQKLWVIRFFGWYICKLSLWQLNFTFKNFFRLYLTRFRTLLFEVLPWQTERESVMSVLFHSIFTQNKGEVNLNEICIHQLITHWFDDFTSGLVHKSAVRRTFSTIWSVPQNLFHETRNPVHMILSEPEPRLRAFEDRNLKDNASK